MGLFGTIWGGIKSVGSAIGDGAGFIAANHPFQSIPRALGGGGLFSSGGNIGDVISEGFLNRFNVGRQHLFGAALGNAKSLVPALEGINFPDIRFGDPKNLLPDIGASISSGVKDVAGDAIRTFLDNRGASGGSGRSGLLGSGGGRSPFGGVSGGISFGQAQKRFSIPFLLIVGAVLVLIIRPFGLFSK